MSEAQFPPLPEPGPVPPDRLRRRIDPSVFGAASTAELDAHHGLIGQDRALDAIAFGAAVRHRGFHIYVMGEPGSRRRTALRSVLEDRARAAEPPPDWVYVNNFADERRPKALRLPHGMAVLLRDAMAGLIEDLVIDLPAAFETEDYKARRGNIDAAHQARQQTLFEALAEQARNAGIAIIRTPTGFAFAPLRDGEVMKPDEIEKLSAEERRRIEASLRPLQEALADLLQNRFPAIAREYRAAVRAFDREIALQAIRRSIAEVSGQFAGIEPIEVYLRAVEADLAENVGLFRTLAEEVEKLTTEVKITHTHPALRRYRVNVMTGGPESAAGAGAPLVEETDPSYGRLIGVIEHQPVQGALITDFTMIKPGSLLRANGGYILIDALALLMAPLSWHGLKRVLKTGELTISLGDFFGPMSTVSLEPEPIPVSVKVALIGDRMLYYRLAALDPEFGELFKVQADFDDDIAVSDEALQALGRSMAALVAREGLKPLAADGLALLMEEASRIADDACKLTLRVDTLGDIVREADHWSAAAGNGRITADDIERAVRERRRRASRVEGLGAEMITRGVVNIQTDGSAIGQINGLSVLQLGGHRFGRPSRISARVRMGTGKVTDIEREVELGGPLHSKGVLILQGFLAARFGRELPLSLAASLVFEQSYGGVDGDSASSTELYALLSALAEAPIDQGLAVTGSVDQFGRVQAIGGVNEKIEGFFEICRRRGLTGRQGVLIPCSNVQHLNLAREVVEAVEKGQFAIHAVDHVDTGISLLTGVPAGEPDETGAFPEDTINGRVAARLAAFAEARRRFAEGESGKKADS